MRVPWSALLLLVLGRAMTAAAEPPPSALPPIFDIAQLTFPTERARAAGMEELQRLEAAIAMVQQRLHQVQQGNDDAAWQSFTWLTRKVEADVRAYQPWFPDPGASMAQVHAEGLQRAYGYDPLHEPTPTWVQSWVDLRARARAQADAADGLTQSLRDLQRLRDQLAAALGISGNAGRP